MKDGDISNQVLPTVLFHYSTIFDEKGWGIFKRLVIKENLPPAFKEFLRKTDDINTAIVAPLKWFSAIEDLTKNMPLRCPYIYNKKQDLIDMSENYWQSVAAYYDNNSVRGGYWGNRWHNV